MSDLNSTNLSIAKRLLIVAGMLIAGTGSIIFGKLQFQTQAIGRDGKMHYFTKPLFKNAAMFLGMSFSFGLLLRSKKKPKSQKLSQDKDKKQDYFRLAKLVFLPAFCDFLATYLMNFGLIFLPASVWQLLRASIIVFTAILTKYYRKRAVPNYQWAGVVFVIFGLLVVGVAGIMGSDEQEGQQFSMFVKTIGVLLVIAAELVQATQNIVEEKLLHDYEDTNPAVIVGFEGVWGFLLCVVISAPVAYFLPESTGMKEDSIDSFVMLANSTFLIWTTFVFIFVILFFNYFAMEITNFSSALLRNILDGLRTLLSWIVLLIIHYTNPGAKLGEKWTNWSYLQLFGFVFLILGTFLYNQIVKIPFLKYPPSKRSILEQEKDMEKGNLLKDSDSVSVSVNLSDHLSNTSSSYSDNSQSGVSSRNSSVN
ncbi:hypothetical protein M0812_05986 [Anaeramoeba flamelloides]|uniref:EamA domain-containing protein n=1 Tax=Anaeramoeba flamelloides TaxID=1746091 RepID=A0AAV8A8S4_9EUKA|nr:hypothetical protein M0812_05986 [Anaeramoeba flamelloides]